MPHITFEKIPSKSPLTCPTQDFESVLSEMRRDVLLPTMSSSSFEQGPNILMSFDDIPEFALRKIKSKSIEAFKEN
ncbi:hypothetical protein NPIL_100871 [Nephila pilipes]|uniref:Uncharacterized protein n=1 Tax=Nephila pilipes TaxID=299642 RepID=A0A8X6MN80_NEPPI|nr:hypothetical protein NPIL_566171 [Nephila pilipes]GFT15576.1 hypothetical protein NPIL_368331 [Nephila pilipes]GFT56309.1 hypothetical protein NPIL_67791 [Nephila pilipes]GFT65413.1 hypothetical protein NPIL_100871 [Nephila pilipes]